MRLDRFARHVAFTSAVLLLPGLAALGAQAQAPLPTAASVIDKYIAAVGGRAALQKITSQSAKGTLDIAELGISGTIVLNQKAPNKTMQVLDLAGVGVTREGYDGTTAWSEDPQNGVREKTSLELAEARRGAAFPRELQLTTIYPKMAVTARERVADREAYVVTGTPTEGPPVLLYFDVESGLLVRQKATRQTATGPVDLDSTFEDYRVVDGLKRPHVIRQANPQFAAIARFSEIKHNVPMDDAIFRKPR